MIAFRIIISVVIAMCFLYKDNIGGLVVIIPALAGYFLGVIEK